MSTNLTSAADLALLTTEQTAETLGVDRRTLARWATQGRGPRRVVLGTRYIRYRPADVAAWLAEHLDIGEQPAPEMRNGHPAQGGRSR